MDRTAWIAISLCVLGLVISQIYLNQTRPKPLSAGATPAATLSPSPAFAVSPTPSPLGSPAAFPSPSPLPTPATPAFTEVKETLRNSDVEFHLTNRGGGIAEAVLLHHTAEGGKRVALNSGDHIPIGAIIDNPAAPSLPEYKMTRQGDAVEFEYVMPEQVTIRKKYSFAPTQDKKDNYLAELDVDVQNTGVNPYTNSGYYLALGSAAPIHPKDYPSYTRLVWCVEGRAKGIDVTWFAGSSGFLGIGQHAAQPFYEENVKGADWAAVSSQFFATIIAPLDGKADSVWGRHFDIAPEQKMWGIEGAMHMPALKIPPGQTYHGRFQIYAGPKLYHKLASMEHNEAEIMNFGIFKLVSQFLLNFMNWLHNYLGSYAIAILALTTIIRLVLWPIQGKANRSMRQMAALSPKMQELKEKYKDDPTKMNQEVMKMYKQYGINPVGGCLPMLIQIPIFFGLYQMLGQAVELRNQKFLWVHDLSQPDTVAHVPSLGWPINILPLCMAVTQVWLMQMTPKTGDATQRRVMMFTPLIFMFICYNFAAALALYYTAQNLFSILQFYQNRNQPMPTLEKVQPPGKGSRKK
jgi:YidC/Oxa1 family membrane protein insertase